jgi:hypothetical protein
MVSDEKQYEFITSRISDLSNDTIAGLKLFIPMYSAILGGSIWLKLQLRQQSVPASYKYLSDSLVSLLTLVCIYIVIDNLWAWWKYRNQLCRLTRRSHFPAPPPHWSSAIIEGVICVAMAIACGMFIWFNPFGSSN